ncbi:MAG: hypothetical protein KF691_02620 [Phycisphaeraceae bacterium]|nr:hypothetical protein [Phycisphaeraceae bacterium]
MIGRNVLMGLAIVAAPTVSHAAFVDDFESYVVSAFPSPKWLDARTLIPSPNTPNPSGRIINTLGPGGTLTKAFRTQRSVGTSQGIYARFAPTRHLSISADVRFDFWDNSTNGNGGGWPLALGFFNATPGNDPNFAPQVMIVADSTNKTWTIYTQTGPAFSTAQFIPLSVVAPGLNTWYNLALDVDTETGLVSARVRLSSSAGFIVNTSFFIPNWDSASAQYNVGAALDGEYGTNATLGGQATVDNILLIPSPAALVPMTLGVVALRRRKR